MEPVIVAAKLLGGPSVAQVGQTTSTTSFDAALVPLAFDARTRTKYVPAPTPPAEKMVAAFPVLKFARSASPELDPA